MSPPKVVTYNRIGMKFIFRKFKLVSLSLAFYILPFILVAQAAESGKELAQGFVQKINQAILYPLISLLLGVAMLVFLYGAYEYVANADNENSREVGQRHMLWGVVGLLVMVSAVAILQIAANTFGVGDQMPSGIRR